MRQLRTSIADPPREFAPLRPYLTPLALLLLLPTPAGVAQMLEALPPPETALAQGDRELFRSLQAAEAARAWVVGHQAGDGVDRPARGSALGDGSRIYGWDETETARHYESAMRDWSERR